MNIDSILLSDYATIEGGKLTVVGVFNRVPTSTVPAILPFMSISLVIHGHSSEAGSHHEFQIKLLNARRQPVTPDLTGEFVFPQSAIPWLPVCHFLVSSIVMPQFPEIGPYAFEVYIDGTYHASASFYVGPEG